MSEPTHGTLAVGQIFHGRYEIVRCLKAGGMGAVYECVHMKTRKHRALKVMLPQIVSQDGMRDRFELEARVTAEIDSDHIVETFDAGVDEATGAPFLVMELLRGEDLSTILARRGALSAGEVILFLSQAGLALDKTHEAGIVHRDLKPENLYVTMRDDGSPRLKILDFGIAKVVADRTKTVQQTAMIGTPLYMPPEQILGEGTIGPRADGYAMGHIAFALLTGRAYWEDEQQTSPAVFTFLGKVMAGPPELPTARAARRGIALPPAFDTWFARATARSASDRFDRVSTLVQELAVILGVWGSRPMPASEPSRLSSPQRTSEAAFGSGPLVAPARTGGENSTVGTASKSIVTSPARPWGPAALIACAVLAATGIGLVVVVRALHAPSPATIAATVASTPSSVGTAAIAVDPKPVEVAPPPSASASPAASSARVAAPPAPAKSASPSDVSKPPPRAAPPAKPPSADQGCDPPYVIDGAGHRRMKPQCL